MLTPLPPKKDILQERRKAPIKSQAYSHVCHCAGPPRVRGLDSLSSLQRAFKLPCLCDGSVLRRRNSKPKQYSWKLDFTDSPPPPSHLISLPPPSGLSVPNSELLSFPKKCPHVTSEFYTTTQVKFTTASRTKGTAFTEGELGGTEQKQSTICISRWEVPSEQHSVKA